MTLHSQSWQLRTRSINFSVQPALMGIVNVTPDSFSDGGRFLDPVVAVDHALELVEAGADILDIGGESTRPYATPVDVTEELRRVIPVIERLAHQTTVPISVDTSKAAVAREAIAAGAEIINDITGLQGDPSMVETAVASSAGVCVMHIQGTPQTMQDDPRYGNVVDEVYEYLAWRRDHLIDAGIQPERICLDPGIGFGKSTQHNVSLLAKIDRFHSIGQPILVGHSRKGFIGKLTGDISVDRLAGTTAITLWLAQHGVQVIRLHDVAAARQALSVMESIINAGDQNLTR